MASYLVTGGAGFIGSHLAEELLRRGQRVRVADSLITGKRGNLIALGHDVEFLEGDLAEPAFAELACAGMDYVLHQAAIPSVPRSVADELMAKAMEVAEHVTSLPPLAARLAKEAVAFGMDSSIREAANADLYRFMALELTEDKKEAHQAWRERRKPALKGR